MKKGSTFFLRGVIYLLAVGALTLCLYVFPRAIMSKDLGYFLPIIIGMYISAIPFCIALYESLKLLNYIDANKTFSDSSVQSLKVIKYCGSVIAVLYAAGLPYIFYAMERDDAPGGIVIALVIVFASVVIAVFAGVLQRLLQNVIEIKSENELTV